MSIIYKSDYTRYYIQKHPWNPFLITKDKYSKEGKLYTRKGLLNDNILDEDQIIICYTPGKIYDVGVKKKLMDNGEYKDIGRYRGVIPFLNDKNKALRLYGLFLSAKHFYQYYRLLKPQHFYEIIQGDRAQKTHFDIDINCNDIPKNYTLENFSKFILNNLLITISNILKRNNITLDWEKDFLIYQSHSEEKHSYHVILKHYCHNNHKEALFFYNIVINEMGEFYSKFIDRAVYSKLQAFRLVNSSKYNTTRYKKKIESITLDKEYIFTNCEDEMEEWCHSLVSYTHYCLFLPNFKESSNNCLECNKLLEERLMIENNPLIRWTLQQLNLNVCSKCELLSPQCKNNDDIKNVEITFEEANGYIKNLEKFIKSYNCFQIRCITDNRIDLDIKMSYTCPICSRRHDSENPFLLLENNNVYFFCRRANKRILFLNKENIPSEIIKTENTLIGNVDNNVKNMDKNHTCEFTLIKTGGPYYI